MPKSRVRPTDLVLPRGRPPLAGTPERKQYDRLKADIAKARETSVVANGIPVVRRGKPPADPDARKAWEEHNALARQLRQSGIGLVGKTKTPGFTSSPIVEETKETDAQILARHIETFRYLHDLAGSAARGEIRALIAAGGPGIGKTWSITEVLTAIKSQNKIRFKKISGKITPIELFKYLYYYRGPKDVLLIDDADSLFFTEDGLNLLKAALDSLDERIITWRSNTALLVDNDDNDIPREFDYEGSVIFISNLDFDRIISGTPSRLSDHLRAVINRAIYFDLRMHSARELAIWVRHVVETKQILQSKRNLSKKQEQMVLAWMDEHREKMREVSIRSAMHIGTFVGKHTKDWEKMAMRSQIGRKATLNLLTAG